MITQLFLHVVFLAAIGKVAYKLRLGMEVEVCTKIVHACELFATELARHILRVMTLTVLLEIISRKKS